MPFIPDPQIPNPPGPTQSFATAVIRYLRQIQQQLNALSNGSIAARLNANTAPPAAGNKQTYAKGDFIPNSNPVQLGASGSIYVVTGWICIAAGTPGTWVACRALTGN